MKRIINIISITLGIFIFTACQDELNNELFHKFSYLVENGWQTCEVEIKDGNIAELLIDFGINGKWNIIFIYEDYGFLSIMPMQ